MENRVDISFQKNYGFLDYALNNHLNQNLRSRSIPIKPDHEDYIIITESLKKYYNNGKIHAVNGLNLKIKRGEIYAFIGANGSGKSTTIDMLSGVLKPTAGSIQILGYSQPKDHRKISYQIGIAPQEYSIYLDLTIWENLFFFGGLCGCSKAEIKKTGEKLLSVFNLKEKENTISENLSGGMKRRLSLAISLIHNPDVLLFDEATVGVDPVLRAHFWEYFYQLRKEGKTILITSHVMDEAERADRIGLMREGLLIEESTPAELKQKYHTDTIEEIFIILSEEAV